MVRILIVSDQSVHGHNLEEEFSRFGWISRHISMHTLLNEGSAITKDFNSIAFVINDNFRKNLIGVIGEMESLICNCSKFSTVYLLFEEDYDSVFASWLAHVKHTFKSIHRKTELEEAVNEIIKLSYEPVPISSFVSPMNGC
jgi:hypothetical protein